MHGCMRAKKKGERKKDKKLGATVKHGKHKHMQDGEETLQIKLVEQNVTLARKPCVIMCLLLLLLVRNYCEKVLLMNASN